MADAKAGFIDIDTNTEDFDKLDFPPLEVGTVIEGKVLRPFFINDEKGKGGVRVAYECQATDGSKFGLSERAAYKRAFRSLPVGSEFRLTFVDSKSLDKGRTMWEVKLAVKPGDGEACGAVLLRDFKKREAAGENVPF